MYQIKDSIGFQIGAISLNMKKSFNKLAAYNGVSLTTEQWSILNILKAHDGLTQTEITQILQKDKTTITRAIDTLSQSGYVIRTQNPSDRRVHIIKLTDKAVDALNKLTPHIEDYLSYIVSDMTKDELTLFKKQLKALNNKITQMDLDI